MGEKKPWSDLAKILHWGGRDLITYAKFGDDRLRGFVVAMSQILGFRRGPYNTLALPCGCDIIRYY